MHAIIGLLIIVGVLGSPLWLSLAIMATPRRRWPVDLALCAVQAVVAYSVWWFFWGGGIGGEARLSPSWEWLGVLAFLPAIVGLLKHVG